MSREEFSDALARYGSDLARWPDAVRSAAEALLARDPVAARDLADASRLDTLLAQAVRPVAVDAAMIGRIVSGIAGPQPHEASIRPTGRLFAWAGAAMALFLVVGFVIGLALPYASDDDAALAALMFGTDATTTYDTGGVL